MMTIGQVARKAQCSVPTIRYYESIGLLPEAPRRDGGHRVYEKTDLERLILIRRCRDLDMPIDKIRELLVLETAGRPCAETLEFFKQQRLLIEEKIQSLKELDATLSTYIKTCQSGCLATGCQCDIYKEMVR